jgi:hypothetical protein
MSRHSRALLVTFVLVIAGARAGAAQTGNRFALGANLTSRFASAPENLGQTHVGLQWRIGHGGGGWGWKYGLNWYSVRLDRPVGGRVVELGELHVRPFMAGYGYTRTIHNTAISANLLGGFAFSGFSLDDRADAVYQTVYGVDRISTRASNTFVLKPELSAWHDMGRKVGLHASIGYMIARPDVEVDTGLAVERHHVRADVLQLKIGVVYSIF